MDLNLTHEMLEYIIITLACLEVGMGMGIISFMLFKHRAKLELSLINVIVIYLTALNPFAVRDLTKNLVNYLEEL